MPNSSLRVWSLGLKEVDLEGGLGISGVIFLGFRGLEFWVAKGFYRVSGLVGFRVTAEGVGANGCGFQGVSTGLAVQVLRHLESVAVSRLLGLYLNPAPTKLQL